MTTLTWREALWRTALRRGFGGQTGGLDGYRDFGEIVNGTSIDP